MPYFHVLIAFESDTNKFECPFQDLSEEELKSDFLSAYQTGSNIFHNGEIIKTNEISKVQIIKTDTNSRLELKKLQEKSSREIDDINRNSSMVFVSLGRGYETTDLSELGTDVTSNYIHGAPGYIQEQEAPLLTDSLPSKWQRIINHQWFVAIFSGLIFLVLAVILGA